MLTRRAFATTSLALGATSAPRAQGTGDWPDRSVAAVVPWPAGGPTDAFARLLSQRLSSDLGRPFVVDNCGGANGTIGMASAARARPDGYTVVIATNSTYAAAPHLYQVPYDADRAFVGVGLLVSSPLFHAGAAQRAGRVDGRVRRAGEALEQPAGVRERRRWRHVPLGDGDVPAVRADRGDRGGIPRRRAGDPSRAGRGGRHAVHARRRGHALHPVGRPPRTGRDDARTQPARARGADLPGVGLRRLRGGGARRHARLGRHARADPGPA